MREGHGGDLRRLVESLQRRGLRVTVVSTIRTQPAMIADELRRQADVFLDLSDLAEHITRRQIEPRPRLAANNTSRAAAAPYADRLLPLPPFLLGSQTPSGPAEWLAGLRLTGHFLGKDAFGHQHKPLPTARDLLFHRVAALAEAESTQGEKGQDA